MVPDVEAALAEASRRLNATESLDDVLATMVAVACRSLPEIDHAGVTVARQDVLRTTATTDEFVLRVDQVQYDLGSGPCVDALHGGGDVLTVVDHVRAGGRQWPDFLARAARLGVRSMMALRLFRDQDVLGVLNLYSVTHDVIDADTQALARMFAPHAAVAYSRSLQVHHLRRAVETRELVGQAVGIAMERYGLTSDQAFNYLVRVSSTSETKLREVAQRLVEGVGAVDPGDASPRSE